MSEAVLLPGDPAPWFVQRCTVPGGSYALESAAGRFIVLAFFPSAKSQAGRAALAVIAGLRALFDDRNLCLFGVSADPDDVRSGGEADHDGAALRAQPPGIRFFLDGDGKVSRLYGRLDAAGAYRPAWIVLDPMLRVVSTIPFGEDDAQVLGALLRALPPVSLFGTGRPVPALLLDRVFEPAFCERLIGYYERSGNRQSGIFAEREGRAQALLEPGFKRRRDCMVKDPELVQQIQLRIIRRVVPDLQRATQFGATRLERLLVACYDAEDRGHFGPHRDNTVPAVAHRRFACSVNLNGEYEGGDIVFPEFGDQRFRPGPGSAIVFSCSLLHQIVPVSRGRRFALLPFLFDEQAARIKQANAEAIRHGNEEAGRALRS